MTRKPQAARATDRPQRRAAEPRSPAGAAIATLAMLAVAFPTGATEFLDISGVYDSNCLSITETTSLTLFADPGQLEICLPRIEPLPSYGEIAVYNQAACVFYSITPPPDREDQTEWFTRFTWGRGRLIGVGRISIETTTDVENSVSAAGLSQDLSRCPGAYYTAFTPSIQNVPGIVEAMNYLEATRDSVQGMPGGDIGLAQRWAAYIRQVLQAGTTPAPDRAVEDAGWAWTHGIAKCDGMANVFASGMRTLGIPTCVMVGYATPGGPSIEGYARFTHAEGLHAWAGAWSEGLGAFVPLDIPFQELGFLSCQRIHFSYHDDLRDWHRAAFSENVAASWNSTSYSAWQTSSSANCSPVRSRFLADGSNRIFLANNVTGTFAPGDGSGTSGVDDTPVPVGGPERLLVGSPFRETLSASLILPSPGDVSVDLFDVRGRHVACLGTRRQAPAGESFFRWLPRGAPSGVYYVRATLGEGRRVLSAPAVLVR